MPYDLDHPQRGVRECPRCRFTMEYLRNSRLLDSDEGYILDRGVWWDPDDHAATSFLFGDLRRYLWRHFIHPLTSRFFGNIRNRRYQKILRQYPESLICTHCGHVLKRK